MRRSVVILDDSTLAYYRRALDRAGYQVVEYRNVDDFLDNLHKLSGTALFIIDVMMPTGERLRDVEQYHGLRTGWHIYRTLVEHYPDIPVVVLTNLYDIKTRQLFIDSEPAPTLLQKADCLPFDLVTVVQSAVGADMADGPT